MSAGALRCLRCLVGFVVLGLAGPSGAQSCPPLPNQVTTRVAVTLGFDAASGLYAYRYTVNNDASSAQEVKSFGVDFTPVVSAIGKPDGWSGRPMRGRSTVYWGALRVANPDEVTNDARVPASIVQIKPGSSLSGFSFQSPRPPGLVRYYAVGHVSPEAQPGASGVDAATAELNAETLAEQLAAKCPLFGRPILEQAATGTTVGPVNAIPVQVDVKPGSYPNAINPRSEGVVPVAILGTKAFDARDVDTASVRVGPAQASPRGAHVEDVNGDGIPDVLFLVPTQSIGIQCQDTFLVISGKTVNGAAIAGFDSITTVGCK